MNAPEQSVPVKALGREPGSPSVNYLQLGCTINWTFTTVQAEQWDAQWLSPSAVKESDSEELKRFYNLVNDTFLCPLPPPLKHSPSLQHMWSPSEKDSFALSLAEWSERKRVWSHPQRDVLQWYRRRPSREVRKLFSRVITFWLTLVPTATNCTLWGSSTLMWGMDLQWDPSQSPLNELLFPCADSYMDCSHLYCQNSVIFLSLLTCS